MGRGDGFMSKEVDERVVHIEFDNKAFENAVKETINTLDNLDSKLELKNSHKSLEKLDTTAARLDFSNANIGISMLQSRLSSLEIIGITAIQNITNSIINFGKTTAITLKNLAISGGVNRAFNIDQARFQIEGLGKDFEKLKVDINEGVRDTAYGFDEAAKAAAVMVASGVKSGTEMQNVLRGISGLAAMTGSQYSEIADIVSAAAGAGKIMTEQLRQFEHRGINVAATLAKSLHKSEDEIRKMVTKGEISFKTFSQVMSETFGEHAQDANKTFNGVISNIKATLSRMGEKVFLPAIETNKKDVLVIDAYKKFDRQLMKIAQDATEAGGNIKENFGKELRKLPEYANVSDEKISQIYKKYSGLQYNLVSVLQAIKRVFGVLENTFKTSTGLKVYREALAKTSEVLSLFFNAVASTFTTVERVTTENGKKITKTYEGFLEVLKGGKLTLVSSEKLWGRFWTTLRTYLGMSNESFKNLKDTVKGIVDFFMIFVHLFSSIFKALFPNVKELGSLGAAILAVTGEIGRFISAVEDAIEKSKIFEAVGSALSAAFTGFNNVLKVVVDKIHTNISGLLDTKAIGKELTSIFRAIIKVLGGSKGVITSIFDGIIKVLQFGFQALEDILSGVSYKRINSISKFMVAFKKAFTPVGSMAPAIARAIELYCDKMEEAQKKLKPKQIRQIAESLLIFAAALALLASVDSKKLAPSLAAIATLLGELYFFSKAVKGLKYDPKEVVKSVGIMTSLIPLAAAILILSAAVKTLSTLDTEEIANGLVALGTVMAELAAFMKVASGIKVGVKGAVAVVIFASAIVILSQAVKMLGTIDAESMTRGLVALGVMLGELAAFMYLSSGIKASVKGAVSILIFSAAIVVLSQAVRTLGEMNLDSIANGLTALGFVLLEIAGFMRLISNTKGMLLKSTGILILATAISVLVKSISYLGNLSEEQIAKGLLTLGGALIIIAGAMRAMPLSAIISAASIVILAQAVGVLADVLDQFASMDTEDIAKSLTALAFSLGILAGAMYLMKDTWKASASMIIASVGISILVASLQLLGSMSMEEIAKSLGVLSAALITFGIASKFINAAQLFTIGSAIFEMGVAVMATGLGIIFLAEALQTLADVSFDDIVKGANNLVSGFNEFIVGLGSMAPKLVNAGMEMLVAFLKGVRKNLPQIVNLAGEIVAEFLRGLAKQTPNIVDAAFDFIESFVKSMSEGVKRFAGLLKSGAEFLSVEAFKTVSDALLELAASAFILSKINVAGAVKGTVALIAFVTGLGLLLTELGALNKIPGLKEFLDGGAELMGTIGRGIGLLVGGIAGGAAEGFTNSLPKTAENLSNFMIALDPFLDGASKLDKNVVTSVAALAESILAFTQANLENTISKWLGGSHSLQAFAKQLSEFLPVFIEFSEEASKIDPESIKSVKLVSKAIKAFMDAASAIPNSGGVAGWWFGENDISTFAKQMVPFIDSFEELAAKSSEIPKESFEKIKVVSEAAKTLIDMSASIPNSGGIVSLWTGENDLSVFAEQLSSFGDSFKELTNKVSDISDDSIAKASKVGKAAKALAETASAMPTEEVGWFKTKTTLGLDKFAEQLKPFIEKFKEIIPLVEEINVKSINKISKIAAGAAKIAAISLDDKGIKSFKALSEHLPTLGKNISDYADSVKDANAEQLTAVNKALPSLFKSFSNIEAGTGKNLSELSAQLSSFGRSLKSYAESISGISAEDISATTKQIASSFKNLSKTVSKQGNSKGFKSAGKNATEAIVSGFSSGTLSRGLNKTLTSALKSIKTKPFSDKGEDCAKAFEKGLKSVKFDKTGTAIINSVKGSLKSDAFYSMGQNVSQGYANGVLAKAGVVYAAVRHVVHQAYLEGMKAQDSSSPSKLYAEMGKYVSEGYANGIVAASGQVSKAVKTMVDKGSKTAKSLTTLKSLMNFDDIGNPTIRPVLDLSNVKMGLNSLDSMMNNSYALGIAGTMPTSNVSSASKNITFNNRITVDGTADPTEWADEFMQELEIQARTL